MRVSKRTSQRTRSWNIAKRQLAKGDLISEYVRDSFVFHFVLRWCMKEAQKSCDYVRYTPGIFLTSWF